MHIYLKSELFKPVLFEALLHLGQTGPISLFADLVLPEKFPSTDYFIQSTTIRSSHTLYAVLSIQARVGETTERRTTIIVEGNMVTFGLHRSTGAKR